MANFLSNANASARFRATHLTQTHAGDAPTLAHLPDAPSRAMLPAVPDPTKTPADPIAEIALIPDPQERLGWIAERGRRAPSLTPAARVPAHRVPGCTSAVWLVDESSTAVCQFSGDAEAPILKGLTVLICARASGRAPADVAADATDVGVALGLERFITPTRLNGLRQLQHHIRTCARKHAAPPPPAP